MSDERKSAREEKLRARLRANLQRRKQQSRARQALPKSNADTKVDGKSPPSDRAT